MDKVISQDYIGGMCFRELTEITWKKFLKYDLYIRELINEDEDNEKALTLAAELLRPAFLEVSFRLEKSKEDNKINLFLSPDGVEPYALEQIYFKNNAPKEILENWNIYVGLPPRKIEECAPIDFFGKRIDIRNFEFKVELSKDKRLKYIVYEENLANLKSELERSIVIVMIRELIGDHYYTKYMDDFVVTREEIKEEERLSCDDFMEIMILSAGGQEEWDKPVSMDYIATAYKTYKRKASLIDNPEMMRQEVESVMTIMPAFETMYLKKDNALLTRFFDKGIVPGFLIIESENEKINELRSSVFKILRKCNDDVYLPMGFSVGKKLYIDIMVWDIDTLLNEIADKADELKDVSAISFQPFDYAKETIKLK